MNNKQKTKKIEADADYTDITTGEVIKGEELINRLEKIKTDKQKEKEEEVKEREKSKHYITTHLGNFYHFLYGGFFEMENKNEVVNKIKEYEANYFIRFLRLACEMDYDNGILIDWRYNQDKKPLTKNQLVAILDISTKEWKYTIDYLKDKKLVTQEGKVYRVNTNYMVKGDLSQKGNKAKEYGIIRVFLHGFKHLYDNLNNRERPSLFYIIQLLPYLNVDYNILCSNPLEDNINNIEPLTMDNIATILNLHIDTTRKKVKWFYSKSIAGVGVLAKIITNGKNALVLNPRLMYAGNKREKLESIEKLMNNDD